MNTSAIKCRQCDSKGLTALRCPQCDSDKSFKDGLRKLSNGSKKQRYICRACGHRYSKPSSLNAAIDNSKSSQISAKAKNLDSTQKHDFCAGDVKKLSQDNAGLLTQFYLSTRKRRILRNHCLPPTNQIPSNKRRRLARP